MKKSEAIKKINEAIQEFLGGDLESGELLTPSGDSLGAVVLNMLEEVGMLPPAIRKNDAPWDEAYDVNEWEPEEPKEVVEIESFILKDSTGLSLELTEKEALVAAERRNWSDAYKIDHVKVTIDHYERIRSYIAKEDGKFDYLSPTKEEFIKHYKVTVYGTKGK